MADSRESDRTIRSKLIRRIGPRFSADRPGGYPNLATDHRFPRSAQYSQLLAGPASARIPQPHLSAKRHSWRETSYLTTNPNDPMPT